jgi:transketolase
VGLALAAKMDGLGSRVFTLLGDGELTEGSNWEASASAAHYQLDNLVVLIDRNTLQITNRTEKVMAMEPLAAKFEAFGFTVREVDGNSISGLADLLETLPFESGKPNLVIAHTVKGKGVHFMEDNTAWHHRVPTSEEFEIAMHELELAKEELEAAHA